MKQLGFFETWEILRVNDIMRRFTFKASELGDNYALLAFIQLIHGFISLFSRGKSVDFSADDCFECLSPCEAV